MLLVSFKYIKRTMKTFASPSQSMWVSQYFIVSLEKERKEVSETLNDGIVSLDKLFKTSLNQFINLD